MKGGDSYYVLVNNQDETYETEDPITGYCETLICDSWDEAEDILQTLIADEGIDESDGWHVERHRW